MRDLEEVINKIINLIANKDEWECECALKELEKVMNTIRYVAAENRQYYWNEVQMILIDNFTPPETEIDYQVLSIWTMKSVEELKKQEKERLGK